MVTGYQLIHLINDTSAKEPKISQIQRNDYNKTHSMCSLLRPVVLILTCSVGLYIQEQVACVFMCLRSCKLFRRCAVAAVPRQSKVRWHCWLLSAWISLIAGPPNCHALVYYRSPTHAINSHAHAINFHSTLISPATLLSFSLSLSLSLSLCACLSVCLSGCCKLSQWHTGNKLCSNEAEIQQK